MAGPIETRQITRINEFLKRHEQESDAEAFVAIGLAVVAVVILAIVFVAAGEQIEKFFAKEHDSQTPPPPAFT